MSDLTRETWPTPDLLRPLVPVELPEYGTVYLRRISAAQVLDLAELPDGKQFMAQLLAQSACFADGAPIWPDGDQSAVLAYPMEFLRPLSAKARQLNGLESGALETAKGNSNGDPAEDSSTGSPNASGA